MPPRSAPPSTGGSSPRPSSATAPAIVPAIRGSAWITGMSQVYLDPSDPFPEGYLLSDTWGVSGLDTQ